MKDTLTKKIGALETEYLIGQNRLATLDQETRNLQARLLQVEGAVKVCRELLAEAEALPAADQPQPASLPEAMPDAQPYEVAEEQPRRKK